MIFETEKGLKIHIGRAHKLLVAPTSEKECCETAAKEPLHNVTGIGRPSL